MAGMNFNTSNDTFRHLMANGTSYSVPPFQRDYSWTSDEWDDLWQDIMGLFGEDCEPYHYMGYLVLQSDDSKQFDIIDGQQRITTFSILILASLSHLKDIGDAGHDEKENKQRAEQLRGSYIGYLDPVTLLPESKLTLNRHDNRFYQNVLVPLEKIPQRGLSASEHLLRKAFGWFKEKIKAHTGNTGKEVAKFIDSLVDKLCFTVITVTDELNAFKVFETLNARGVRLSSTDLLKNYLFAVVHNEGTNESEMKAIEERWDGVLGQLGGESFPEFLRVFWNSRNKLVRKSDLFKTIRREITNKSEAFGLIRDLQVSASVYAALRSPLDEMWDTQEQEWLKELQMFSVRQPLALLLACFTRFGEGSRPEFQRVLRAISVISFRYNVICNWQPNEQERLYNDIAVRMESSELTSGAVVVQALSDVYPDDVIFQAAFKDKTLRTISSRNKKVVRYILFELEKHLSGSDYDQESATYNIEHVLPEHPEKGWDAFDERRHDMFVYRLGNMVLMTAGDNRDLGNAEYAEKSAVYRESEFKVTKGLAEHYEEWTPEKIEARQGWMARQAISIWQINF